MNDILKCSGIVCLVLFSFFYTEKAVSITNENDPIMKSILEYRKNDTKKCIEGHITDDGAVLGVSGMTLDVNKSYSNMKGIGFSEELLVFDEEKCEVNSSNIDNYIIGGNKVKDSVSLLLLVDNINMLEEFIKICESKNIKISFVVSGSMVEENKLLFTKVYSKGFDILYTGSDEEDFKKYRNVMKELGNKGYCVYTKDDNILNMCKSYKVNTIKTDIIIEKDLLMNVKRVLTKGSFIILKENKYIKDELSASINFIQAKGLKIRTITSHLNNKM